MVALADLTDASGPNTFSRNGCNGFRSRRRLRSLAVGRLFEAQLGSGQTRSRELGRMASALARIDAERQLIAAQAGLYVRSVRWAWTRSRPCAGTAPLRRPAWTICSAPSTARGGSRLLFARLGNVEGSGTQPTSPANGSRRALLKRKVDWNWSDREE
jgi:hypothetical protein